MLQQSALDEADTYCSPEQTVPAALELVMQVFDQNGNWSLGAPGWNSPAPDPPHPSREINLARSDGAISSPHSPARSKGISALRSEYASGREALP